MADNTLKLAFILSATDKMSRIVDEAVKKSTDKLSSFERTTGKVGRSMVKAGAVMMGAGAAIGGAMFAASKSVADYAGTIKDTSEATGIGVEAWQKMAYAAKISGIEQEKLSGSMVKFDKLIAEAASGSKTASKVFTDLGVKIKDAGGNVRAPNEIFDDVAEKLKNMEDGAEKTARACDFFGKSGAELMPMLNAGKSGLKDLYKAAELTGNVLDDEVILSVDAFGEKLDAVGLQVKGLGLRFGASLIPIMHNLLNRISGIIEKVSGWMQRNPQLAATIGKVAMVLAGLLVTVGTASVVFGTLTFMVGKFATVFHAASTAIKVGKAIVNEYRTGMLLFRIQYAALVVWQKLAAAAQWLFNTSLFACPVVWIIAAIMAVIAAVVLLVKHWDAVAAFFTKLWAKIVGIFKQAWEWIKNMFLNYTPTGLIIHHWNKISDFFVNLWGKVKAIFITTWAWLKNMFLSYTPTGLIIKHWDKIAAWFSILWANVKTSFTNAWDGIKGLFRSLNPVEWIRAAWDSVGAFFGSLGTRFYEWGKNILEGLWNGITSKVTKIVEGVKNIANKIAKGFKAIFGINSPSKLFAEYGQNITQGLVVGIDQGGGAVENATAGMAAHTMDGVTQNMQSSTVNTSNVVNGGGSSGAVLNYSPQITITGTATPETMAEFSKLLKQHANDIISIIQRNDENKARLSFNG